MKISMKENRKRCSKCLYLRHLNDTMRAGPNTCPRCGRDYQKASNVVARDERARAFRSHNLQVQPCGGCNEVVSIDLKVCPRCGKKLQARRLLPLALAASLAALCITSVLRQHAPAAPTASLPGLATNRVMECQSLSAELTAARRDYGLSAPQTLSKQNDWHRDCSRKALRGLAETSRAVLPNTPEEWLALSSATAPLRKS